MSELRGYRDLIKRHYPELGSLPMEVNELGMNNAVVIVDRSFVFRFPRYLQGLKTMQAEVKLLNSLADRLPLDIPNPSYTCFTNSPDESFCGYPMLPGRPFWGNELPKDEARQRKLAQQLARFLNALHSIPRENSNQGDPLLKWQTFYSRVQVDLFKFMSEQGRQKVVNCIEDFLVRENFCYQNVLIHGDFGPTNILWDGEDITGVIDFGSAKLGDPATDIASLMGMQGFDIQFISLMGEWYPSIEKLLDRARFYKGTFALQDALHGLEHNDRSAFQEGMAPYQ